MNPTILTALLLLAAIAVLYLSLVVFYKKAHDKNAAKRKVIFADIAWKNKLEINERETIGHYSLGIDLKNFFLLHVDFSNEEPRVTLLDLWKIQSASLSSDEKNLYEQKNGQPVLAEKQLQKMDIDIRMKGGDAKLELPLFRHYDGTGEDSVREKAKYWMELIDSTLKELRPAEQKNYVRA